MLNRRLCHRFTSLFSIGLFAALGYGCAAPLESETDSEDVESASDALWVYSPLLQGHTVSVCWDDSRFPERRAAVRDAVEDSWSREARVTFTGWGLCSQQAGNIHVYFAPGDSWAVDGNVQLSEGCEECDRTNATHEFGHVLGFFHEQDRPDTPAQFATGVCGETHPGKMAGWSYGPWDICSMMNYCNVQPEALAAGCRNDRLSGWDVEGLRYIYGAKQTGSLVSGNGSRCAAAASSQNGAQIQTATCGTGSEQRFWLDWAAKRIRRRDDQTKCLAPVGTSNLVQQVACDTAASSTQTWTFFDTNATGLKPSIRGLAGKCLTRKANGQGGYSMTLSSCTTSSTDQVFFFDEEAGTIVDAAGMCLDVAGSNASNGAVIQTAACNGETKQQWSYRQDGAFYSALGKCVDVAGSNTADGTPVQIWDCNGTGAQSWSPHVGMQIRGMGGKCLAMAAATTATNVGAKMMYCSDSTTEWWVYSYAAQTIRNQSGQCLQPGGGSTANGTQVVAATCTGSSMQRWTINTSGVISHTGSGKCLDVRAGNPDVGTAAQIYDCNGTNAQKWSLSGTIKNSNGQCLDVKDMNRDSGAAIRTYTCVSNAPAEMWDYYF